MVRLTDRPDMTLDVYRGRKTTMQQQQQSISGRLPERGRKKREMIDERKNVQTTPPAPTASTVGPCPTLLQIRRTAVPG